MSGYRNQETFYTLKKEAFLVYGKIYREKASLMFTSKKIKKMEIDILITEMDEIAEKVRNAELKFLKLKNKLKLFSLQVLNFLTIFTKLKEV